MAFLHWPPMLMRSIPLTDMVEAYTAYHRYHAKPAPETPAVTPGARDFMTEMMHRFPDTAR